MAVRVLCAADAVTLRPAVICGRPTSGGGVYAEGISQGQQRENFTPFLLRAACASVKENKEKKQVAYRREAEAPDSIANGLIFVCFAVCNLERERNRRNLEFIQYSTVP